MPSIAHQKQEAREHIVDMIKKRLEAHPGQAVGIALGAVSRLAQRMTLDELTHWRRVLVGVYDIKHMKDMFSTGG
jgi:hypothetical protein